MMTSQKTQNFRIRKRENNSLRGKAASMKFPQGDRQMTGNRLQQRHWKHALPILILAGLMMTAEPAAAQGPIIYPEKGQSQEQTEKDKSECYTWAKQQSGFDPMAPAAAAAPPSEAPKGGAAKGAAKGAAVGAAGGAIAGNAGKGAAIGGATGAVVGGARRRSQAKEQKQAEEQQAAASAQQRETYDRAFAACMEGRGYKVK
jgi:hypothetical protein